jgi:hypothetical protein
MSAFAEGVIAGFLVVAVSSGVGLLFGWLILKAGG